MSRFIEFWIRSIPLSMVGHGVLCSAIGWNTEEQKGRKFLGGFGGMCYGAMLGSIWPVTYTVICIGVISEYIKEPLQKYYSARLEKKDNENDRGRD